MKVFFHEDFYQVYTSEPASEQGRMESVVEVIRPYVEFLSPKPASEKDIALVHKERHNVLALIQGLSAKDI